MGANLRPPPNNGPPCFRICGQIVHRYGTLYPGRDSNPCFNQLYIIDGASSLNMRMQNNSSQALNTRIVEQIQDLMDNVSPYAAAYKNMAAVEREECENAQRENRVPSVVSMIFHPGRDKRRYNAALHDEVAAVFVGEDGAPPGSRDIVVYPRDAPLRQIHSSSSHIDPMTYPLFFPLGDPGWELNLHHNSEFATAQRDRITQLQYYIYRIAIRPDFSPIHYGAKLFQQMLVDAYVKVEGARLDYIRNNQTKLRAESYQGLRDHLNNEAERRDLQAGKVVVLPSTFPGSPRNMHQLYFDAMALVAKIGKPDLFLTFTCNPKWPEIVQNLLPGQAPCDRPDLVSRVFRLKLEALKQDIFKHGVLGRTIAHVYVVEFQKRGLPHVHMLIHLADVCKLRNVEDIDNFISAQIPDEDEEPELYEIVSRCMIHGPCGHLNNSSPCMVEGKCSKDFPKRFNTETVMNRNGYPEYYRPDNGRTVRKGNVELDNRSVVPYNPLLCKKYNAHINLEACVSIKSVKYLYKYIYKGHDAAYIEFNERIHHDEIKTFVDTRYVSAPEAMWRLSENKMHDNSHSVYRLPVHLPDEQQIFFLEGQEELALDRGESQHTKLTAWFTLNSHCAHVRDFLYSDIPYHFVFNDKDKKWVDRKRSVKLVSRMYTAHIREGERYFLRVLLLHIRGATSFEYLRTYEGTVYETFREACLARGLLQDDEIWRNTLYEAVHQVSPYQIRKTFAFILVHGEANNPKELWNQFKDPMMEDFLHQNLGQHQAEQAALGKIDSILSQFGKSLIDFDLPPLDERPVEELPDIAQMREEATSVRPLLNPEQLNAVDTILNSLYNSNGNINARIFFIDGPGGTGKTFCYNYLINEVVPRGFKVSTCAWTGIAATLLKGGKTIHSLFKLPVPVLDNCTCNITPTSNHAAFLREKNIIYMNEASMIPKYALEAIDKMFRDICNSNVPFAGKVIVLGGDFRQTLPVVKRGTATDVVEVSLKHSHLWRLTQTIRLHRNMRAGPGEEEFAEYLLQLGDGRLPTKQVDPYQGSIEIPARSVLPKQGNIITTILTILMKQK